MSPSSSLSHPPSSFPFPSSPSTMKILSLFFITLLLPFVSLVSLPHFNQTLFSGLPQPWYEHMSVLDGTREYCWHIGNESLRANYLLATNQKNEDRLPEWVGYHYLLGFDGFLIFDDYSDNPVGFLNYLPKEAREKIMIFLRCPNSTYLSKVRVQQNVADNSGLLGAKWFMHLDVDEFLYINPSKFFDLPSWLASYPSNVVQVVCNWLMYGTSFRDSIPDESIFRAFTYRDTHPDNLIKCIQRTIPEDDPFRWFVQFPHYMRLEQTKSKRTVMWNQTWDYQYSLSDGKQWVAVAPISRNNNIDSTCLIVHYFFQSMEDCYRRKLFRPRDDIRKYRGHQVCNHEDYNKVNDPDRMRKYADQLDHFLVFSKYYKTLTVKDFIPDFVSKEYQPADDFKRPNLEKLLKRRKTDLIEFKKDPRFRE